MKRNCLIFVLLIAALNLIGQIHWAKHPDNPIMPASPSGEWDEVLVSPSTVIYQDGLYKMWYWGGDHAKHIFQIGYATSPDGINWTKDKLNNPVLVSGPNGSWDASTLNTPSVLFIDSLYHMWYTGYTDLTYIYRIGHATSANGINWTKDMVNNPVLEEGEAGSWDALGAGDATVIHDGSMYHMWYVSKSASYSAQHMGHATSEDGIKWIKDPMNPVLRAEGGWEKSRIDFPSVVYNGNTFHVWYGAGQSMYWGVGYATSKDGSTWEKDARNPVFMGTQGGWDEKSILSKAIIDSAQIKYKMWYCGNSTTVDDGNIGYAESTPLNRVQKSPTNKIEIYPNPSKTILTIESGSPELHLLRISSMNGQMIYTGKMHGGTHQIDLSSFEKGAYFITISSKDYVYTRKIIKL